MRCLTEFIPFTQANNRKIGTLVTFVQEAMRDNQHPRSEDFDKEMSKYGEVVKPTVHRYYEGTQMRNGNRFCVVDVGETHSRHHHNTKPADAKTGEGEHKIRVRSGGAGVAKASTSAHVSLCSHSLQQKMTGQKRKYMSKCCQTPPSGGLIFSACRGLGLAIWQTP